MAPKSAVWLHCTKNVVNGKTASVTCNVCKKSFAWLGATSTLITHLEKSHKIRIPKLVVAANAKKRKASENAESDGDPDDPSSLPSTTTRPMETTKGGQDHDDGKNGSQVTIEPGSASSSFSECAQGTLDYAWSQVNSYEVGGARHKEITDALLFMMAKDDMPLRTPERKGFRVFTKKINPRYKIPCEPTTTKHLHQKFKTLRAKVKERLKTQKHITLTLDIWTNKNNMKSFIGLTAHFLVDGTTMKSYELTARPLAGRKTIENLTTVIESICDEWGIQKDGVDAVITDGGANIKGAVKAYFGETKHISCFGHILNLIGTKALGLNTKETRPLEQEDNEIDPDLPDDEADLDEEEDDPEWEEVILGRGQQAAAGALNQNPGQQTGRLLKKTKKNTNFFQTQ